MKQTICWLLGLFAISSRIYAIDAIDTGIYVSPSYFSKDIYWLDDDTLLVEGVLVERKSSDPTGARLLRYRIADRSVTDFGQIGGGLCVSNGFVRFWRPTPETADKPLSQQKKISVAGALDNLVEIPPPPTPPPPSPNAPIRDPLHGCQSPHELAVPPWLEAARKSGRRFRALKPEHGWMELFAGDPNYSQQATYPLAIHPPGKEDTPIPIDKSVFQPWLDQGYHVRFVRYEAFKKAYLLALDDTSGRGRENGNFWWLYPDGHTEQILTYGRSGYWQGVRFNGVLPAKNGLFAFSADTYPRSDKSGLYRQAPNGELDLVTRGWAEGYSLSPDGCKLALGIDRRGFRVEGPRRYHLHVVDACH